MCPYIRNNYSNKMIKCKDDNDCDHNYYCYTTGVCSPFEICSRYYREDGKTPARDPSQCGPCMAGYVSERYSNGQSAMCQKTATVLVTDVEDHMFIDKTKLLIVCLVSAALVIACYFSAILFRKRYNYKIRNMFSCFTRNEVTITEVATSNINIDEFPSASAPPGDQRPLIELIDKEKCCNNNNRQIINSEYQTATVSRLPEYALLQPLGTDHIHAARRTLASRNEPSYGNNVLGADVPDEGNIVAPLQNGIPDNQFTMQMTITRPPEVNTEQEDNARNTSLMQDRLPDKDSDSSPELNERNNAKNKSNIIINQLLNQNINMNVNFTQEGIFK